MRAVWAFVVMFALPLLGCSRAPARVPGEMGEGVPAQPFPFGLATCDASLPACKTACDAGNADRCAALGMHHLLGRSTPTNAAAAAHLFEHACNDLHGAAGCYGLGRVSYWGRGVSRDRGRALDLYRGACDQGFPAACVAFARMLHDPARADALVKRACAAGDQDGCAEAGIDFVRARGEPRDDRRAARLLRHACDGGSALGCYQLADFIGSAQLPEITSIADRNAVEWPALDKGCALGSGDACARLGYLVIQDNRPDEGARMIDYACALESANGCHQLSNMAFSGSVGTTGKIDPALGARALYKACRLDDAEACVELGTRLQNGKGVPMDETSAVPYFAQACELDEGSTSVYSSSDGCYELALCYRDGIGVEADLARAKDIAKKACARHSTNKACGL